MAYSRLSDSLTAAPPKPAGESDEHLVLVLSKGDERYIWLYRADQARHALRSLGRFASDPDLSFTWHDAAAVACAMRKGQQP